MKQFSNRTGNNQFDAAPGARFAALPEACRRIIVANKAKAAATRG
ncbi:hypothetical protein [uncultured Castellaniella sp.]|jgi:hypothetical protein|nr:hypothetical protein [uncultured Castellaniella sp.]